MYQQYIPCEVKNWVGFSTC